MANDSGQNARVFQTFWESPFVLKAILFGTFVNNAGGFLRIFIVLFLRHEGYSVLDAGAALTGIAAGSMLGLLVGGSLYARLGPRGAIMLSMTGGGALTIALVYLPGDKPLLYADAVLIGLVSSIFGPVAATLLSALTPPDRQVMIFALSRFNLNLGVTVAPLIGFGLFYLDHHQYTLVFWADGITSLAYAGIALVALSARHLPARPARAAGGPRQRGYGAVLHDQRYLLYLIAAFLGVAVYVQFQTVMPLEVAARHVAFIWYAVAVAVNGAIVIGLELLVTKRSQKWAPRVVIGLSYLLIAVGVSFYRLPLLPVVLIVGTVIWSLGEILGGPATFAYAAMAGPAELKSYYISSFQFVFELGAAAGPIAGAALFVALGHGVWSLIGVAEIVGLLLILAATGRPHPAPAASPAQDPEATPAAADPG